MTVMPIGDRDGDDLGVGGRAVGGLDREVVAGGRLEVESSASLTVIAPVPELMANGRLASVIPVVLPAVIVGEALVVAGRGDGDDRGVVGGVSARLPRCP